jgi:hypothetical protein
MKKGRNMVNKEKGHFSCGTNDGLEVEGEEVEEKKRGMIHKMLSLSIGILWE